MRHLITLVLLTLFSLAFANASNLQEGQVWTYKTRPGERQAQEGVLLSYESDSLAPGLLRSCPAM